MTVSRQPDPGQPDPGQPDPGRPDSGAPKPPTLSALFGVCFSIGLFSFGGGLTAWIHREIVTRRRWMSEDDFLNGFTLAQVLPGANVTNLVVYIGQRLIGPAGAAVALVGLLVGPFLAVIALVSIYDAFSGLGWLHRALDGAAAAAIGLILVLALQGARRAARAWTSMVLMVATVIGIGVLRWPLLPVVVVLALTSVAIEWVRAPK
jgi:chromate transporter